MTRHLARTAVAAVTAGALALGAGSVGAAPVCHLAAIDPAAAPSEVACGNRIFAEPTRSASFIQHDGYGGLVAGEYELGIKALAARFPRFVKVRTLSNLLNDPAAKSYGGREIWVVEVTDFQAPEAGKMPMAFSLSVHGLERAGLEGGIRYAEDLARWATSEPGRLLRNGTEADSTGIAVSEVLRRSHLYFASINPDGWAHGDVHNGGYFTRGNGRGNTLPTGGVDLNREFPTKGWSNRSVTHLSEPEAIHWTRFMDIVRPKVASDIHGELTSVNNAFADLMLPAAQWDPLEQARQSRLARHMVSNVNRYFEDHNVVIGDIAGAAAGMRPADYATGYDVVGYDAAGFMGDWFAEEYGALEMDSEHFLSHLVPNTAWSAPLEQAHVAAVRGEIEALIVDGLTLDEVTIDLGLGKTGYLFDPRVITSEDGYGGPTPPAGYTPEPYSVTPMRYFDELSSYTAEPLRKVPSEDLAAAEPGEGLAGLDTFVVIGDLPATTDGSALDREAAVSALKAFVEDGGNLVLTDQALTLLDDLGVVPSSAVARSFSGAGHVDISFPNADPYVAGVHNTASQTYYEVPLGYSLDSSTSPHWTVAESAWTAAGGNVVATMGSQRVALGRVAKGQGTIGVFGAILPPAIEQYDHFYGLADHAVTVAGGQILANMLRFGA